MGGRRFYTCSSYYFLFSYLYVGLVFPHSLSSSSPCSPVLIIDRLCCRLLSTNIHTQQDCTKDTQLHRKKSAHNEEHLPACMHAYAHTFTGVTQPYFAPCKDVRWCSFFTSASATVITHTRILCTVFLCPLFCLPSCPEGYTTKHMYFHCAIMGLF